MARAPVPDIATLRTICHEGKLSQDRRLWYATSRRISIYLTWLLLHTGVRPNQITLGTVALAVLGSFLLAAPPPWLALWGAVAFAAHHLLDKVDGDIARFRHTYSLGGIYLDELGHSLAFGGLFLGLGVHLAWGAPDTRAAIALLGAAAVGALSMVMGRHNKSMGFLLFAQYVLAQPELMPARGPTRGPAALTREAVRRDRERRGKPADAGGGMLARLRDAILLISDFTVLVVLVATGLALEAWRADARWLTVLLFAEALLQAAVLAALIWINYTVNVEAECRRLSTLVGRRDDDARGD